MEIYNTEGCCSLLEIRYFEKTETADRIIQELKDFYEYEFKWNDNELPYAMFATTKSDQWEAEAALKELKFKATKFKSRHDDGHVKVLTHWWRSTPPTKMAAWFRNLKKRKSR